MKKSLLVLAMLLCMAMPVPPAHALALSLFPQSGLLIHRFDDVFIDINLIGLTSGAPGRTLGAFEMDLEFDPQAFQKIDIAPAGWGPALGNVAAGEALASMALTAPGVLHISAVSLLETSAAGCSFCTGPYLDELQGNSFHLATVGLYAYNPGFVDMTTNIGTRMAVLADGAGNRLPDVPDALLQLTIPEPGTGPLLLLGLVSAAIAGRVCRRSATKRPGP
ncbi:hypothetical protein GCM10027277_58100 [Pseudoduganella ginsengisoli]|nr:PEP-CTERM sorting domain-containing protein [Pseudoduganella ginsengisoli]